ncbi:MAG: hypothetical protein M1462_01920 [Candidatus Thermoplasmatota archaeon]|uniref:hypothetical protein n=1 Tax=Ferroplasma sp. TaxID=2591003 RepID=UPI00261DBBD9|nr:hypothetical protein [Ferroplasma sp.]MCL4311172.1 hypothetical protein [Candidatus Thermoplasmatota archaeon]
MKPDEFKCLALSLMKEISNYKNRMEEGAYRTIIDRYYYFYFLYSRECLKELNVKVSNDPKAHNDIIKGLTNLLNNKHPSIINELKALRGSRNNASYDLNIKISSDDAQLYICQINKIISYIKDEL